MSNRQRWIDFVKKNNPEDTDLYDLLEQAYQMGKADVTNRIGNKSTDSILCHDKEDAKHVFCDIGMENIDDWEYLPNGKVLIVLNCQLKDIADK